MNDVLPNDVLERPGPHHAFEASIARVTQVRGALEALQLLGDAAPIAALLGETTDAILAEPWRVRGLGVACAADDARNLGMRNYGPLLSLAGVPVVTGEPLLPYVNPTVTPVSMFWAEHAPYVPEMVARARDLLALVPSWREIPDEDWEHVRTEYEVERALLADWRTAYLVELDQFARDLAPIAERDGHLILWLDEQGWL